MKNQLLVTALLVAATTAIQVSQVLQKQRAESQAQWRQEATNKFSWNATQELKWSVVNSFIDVQTSPDGDVYAIQSIKGDMSEQKYFVYKYDIVTNIWTILDKTFQAKAVRFDRLGNMYYLTPKNCVLNSNKEEIICGLFDFEVTVNKEIIGLSDGTLNQDTLGSPYHQVYSTSSMYYYKALGGQKGITLLKDEPILIDSNGYVDTRFGTGKFISISAGIDGSLWALLDEDQPSGTDYSLVKWQTVAQKWYKVEGATGINLSAYNEISVALVNKAGLLSLSSQANQQKPVSYTG
ncbi:UNKNOWN [Stylonychia lemnae]|uniref:Uncharacterized protein n=1 Tax=Stylonychia lemnae TaxID=5949 RepID=A0A078B9R9_STYLE|nr:UNKNOWN [Stylonychia lemnae]|eukprot:CDW90002.1 UNKNOWN [Stylonychia lemnae]